MHRNRRPIITTRRHETQPMGNRGPLGCRPPKRGEECGVRSSWDEVVARERAKTCFGSLMMRCCCCFCLVYNTNTIMCNANTNCQLTIALQLQCWAPQWSRTNLDLIPTILLWGKSPISDLISKISLPNRQVLWHQTMPNKLGFGTHYTPLGKICYIGDIKISLSREYCGIKWCRTNLDLGPTIFLWEKSLVSVISDLITVLINLCSHVLTKFKFGHHEFRQTCVAMFWWNSNLSSRVSANLCSHVLTKFKFDPEFRQTCTAMFWRNSDLTTTMYPDPRWRYKRFLAVNGTLWNCFLMKPEVGSRNSFHKFAEAGFKSGVKQTCERNFAPQFRVSVGDNSKFDSFILFNSAISSCAESY